MTRHTYKFISHFFPFAPAGAASSSSHFFEIYFRCWWCIVPFRWYVMVVTDALMAIRWCVATAAVRATVATTNEKSVSPLCRWPKAANTHARESFASHHCTKYIPIHFTFSSSFRHSQYVLFIFFCFSVRRSSSVSAKCIIVGAQPWKRQRCREHKNIYIGNRIHRCKRDKYKWMAHRQYELSTQLLVLSRFRRATTPHHTPSKCIERACEPYCNMSSFNVCSRCS